MFTTSLFYFFAAILIFAALRVVTSRNPVHSALWLVLAFFTAAAIWLMLHAEFLAIVLVLVYVGAVMVLFLFVVMMLDVDLAPLREGYVRYLPVGLVVAVAMLVQILALIGVKAAVQAHEQCLAEGFLQALDALGQRRLGDVQGFGRARKIQLARQHHERFDLYRRQPRSHGAGLRTCSVQS